MKVFRVAYQFKVAYTHLPYRVCALGPLTTVYMSIYRFWLLGYG